MKTHAGIPAGIMAAILLSLSPISMVTHSLSSSAVSFSTLYRIIMLFLDNILFFILMIVLYSLRLCVYIYSHSHLYCLGRFCSRFTCSHSGFVKVVKILSFSFFKKTVYLVFCGCFLVFIIITSTILEVIFVKLFSF